MLKPDEVIMVYDNGGETYDRYSIHVGIFDDVKENYEEYLFTSSTNPTHPMGFWSTAESHQFDVGEHLGREIDWDELPLEVKKTIKWFMEV